MTVPGSPLSFSQVSNSFVKHPVSARLLKASKEGKAQPSESPPCQLSHAHQFLSWLARANQLVLNDLEPYNRGTVEDAAAMTNSVGIGEGTIIHRHTAIRGPVVIGDRCEIGPNACIGPYTSIGDHVTLLNTEMENSIVMNGSRIDCGKKITDSLIGKDVEVLDSAQRLPEGHRLIVGDSSKVSARLSCLMPMLSGWKPSAICTGS